MKRADEIQEGIERCYFNQPKLCRNCPYSEDGISCGRNGAQIIVDALEYIKTNEKLNQCREDYVAHLTAELETTKRERDAAVKGMIKLCLISGKGDLNE